MQQQPASAADLPDSNLSDPRLPDPTTVSHRHHASGAVPGANTALSDPAAAAAALPAPAAATTALPHAAALSDAAARRGFLSAATALLWNVLPSSSCLPRAAPMLALTLQSIIQVATQTISSALRRRSGLALLAACLIGPRAEAAWDGGSHALRIDHPHSALEEGAVHSIESKTRASLQFVNLTGKDLELFWLDFHGQRKPFGTLPAGKAVTKATYLTHKWLVTTKKGRGLAIFKPEGVNSTVLIDPMSAPRLGADAARLRSEGGGAPTTLKFVNPTGTPIDFYWVDFTGARHPRGSVAPHSELSQPTFAKHVWLVTSADGKTEAVFVAKETAQSALLAPDITEAP